MIFNGVKKTSDLHFLFRGEEIEINNMYTYLGVQFLCPRFSLSPTLQPQINKGYGSLSLLKRRCFQHHFQDISSKMSLMDTFIHPIFLYGSNIWGSSLLESDWALAEKVQIILLHHIIRCKLVVPQHIILTEFGAQPFQLETVFRLVSFLHLVPGLADSIKSRDRYPYLPYFSSDTIAYSTPSG